MELKGHKISFQFYLTFVCLLVIACGAPKLPVINIEEKQAFEWEEKNPCIVSYSHSNGKVKIGAKARWRGGISVRYDKHSYAMELDAKLNLCGLGYDDDWILNASYIDKTFMRHRLSFDLFKEMGRNNIAANCAYVKLMLNGNYEGLYILMQEINGGMVGLNKADPKAMIFKDPPIFWYKRPDSIPLSANFYQQKWPRLAEKDESPYLESFMDLLFESSDSTFEREIADWIDLENIIDWHLLLLLSNNSDGILKNFYLYKLNAQTPFRLAIWDYDHSFGRDGDNELNMIRPLNVKRSILLKRLMETNAENYTQRLKAKWHSLRKKNIISIAHIEDLMGKYDQQIRHEIPLNQSRWPYDARWYFDDNGYEEELEIMITFTKRRIPELDAYFENLL